ncbi:MAG: hypothetical protein WCE30_20315, partial [Mycobacterium sp.]
MGSGGMAVRGVRPLRVWLLVLAVVLTAWTMLGVADGVAWAEGGGKGTSGHSATHDPAKPAPAHHRTKTTA